MAKICRARLVFFAYSDAEGPDSAGVAVAKDGRYTDINHDSTCSKYRGSRCLRTLSKDNSHPYASMTLYVLVRNDSSLAPM